MEKSYLAGGCFWCVEAIFQRVNGVIELKSGYCNGSTQNPSYESICTGQTGHAEVVEIDFDEPMMFLGRLVQNDFCILQKANEEHVLTAASLCFPASWSLDEKFLKPLIDIHVPVKEYDDNIAKRVQRLFDGLQINQPVWRFNAMYYEDPNLFQPRSINQPRRKPAPNKVNYFRSERQTLIKLPESEAIIFGIHTFVVHA